MTTIYTKNSLDWVISMGIHIKSDKLACNGWKWHTLAIIMVSSTYEQENHNIINIYSKISIIVYDFY